jgi:uncharacterized protein
VIVYFPSGASVLVELATTPDQIRRGLMHRPTVPDGTGMLFDMRRTATYRFWMKNVLVPLDMVFLTEAGVVVGICSNIPAHDVTPHGVQAPSRYVLEVPGGWCARNGVTIDQRAFFR